MTLYEQVIQAQKDMVAACTRYVATPNSMSAFEAVGLAHANYTRVHATWLATVEI